MSKLHAVHREGGQRNGVRGRVSEAGLLDMQPGRALLMRGTCPVTEYIVPLADTYRPSGHNEAAGRGTVYH